MNKAKSTFVTIIISVMLAVIAAGMYKLFLPGFIAITGALAAYGFFHSASDFNRWLSKEPPLTVAELPGGRPDAFYNREKDADEKKAPVEFSEADQQLIDSIVEEMREATAD